MQWNNPYSGRGQPVSGDRLVGRTELLTRVVNCVQSMANCSIVGLPRIGKTSIARETLRHIEKTAKDTTGGYITLDAIRGPIQAYTRIIQETAPDQSPDTHVICTNNHDDAYSDFIHILRKRQKSGYKSVLVMDEMDAIVREFSDTSLFISRLREVANDRDRYGMTFVFVSRRSLDMIQGMVDYSTLAGLCETIYLPPLTYDGLQELCNRSLLNIDHDTCESLWQITGGHPFLSEVVMCEATEEATKRQAGHISKALIEDAQHRQSHEFTNQYQQLARLLSQDQMFDSMCELLVGPLWRRIDPHTVSLLTHYGLLKNRNKTSENIECMSQHFKEYLALITRKTPTWDLLGDTERRLRYLIQAQMQAIYGEDWFEQLRSKHPNLRDALDKLPQLRDKEQRQFASITDLSILDYAYISDLKDLVYAEWKEYQPILRDNKSEWEKRFQNIIKVRNPMAHNRSVPEDIVIEAENSCKILLARLTGQKSETSILR